LFRPFKELPLSQVIPDIVISSVFRSSNWSSYIWLPFMYFLHNAGFSLSVYVSVPAQSLGFNVVYYVSMLYNSSNSIFVLLFQLPSFFLVGPNTFLNIFLSNTESFWIMFSLRTHVSHPYTTTGLITIQYNFSLAVLDTSLLIEHKTCLFIFCTMFV